MAHLCRRLSLLVAVAVLLALDASAMAATRAVSVGPGLTHTFVDAVSGTSTSTIAVGDTVQWTWSSGFHSTTSGPCGATTCTADGKWDSGAHATPFSFSHTATFATAGTYHYHCAVHLALMQGDIVECAAVGVPDPHSGEAVKLFAVSKSPELSEADVRRFLTGKLAAYKMPKYVEFRKELPKTNVGKILRRALRDNP